MAPTPIANSEPNLEAAKAVPLLQSSWPHNIPSAPPWPPSAMHEQSVITSVEPWTLMASLPRKTSHSSGLVRPPNVLHVKACDRGIEVNALLTLTGFFRTRRYRVSIMRDIRADRRRVTRFSGFYDELQTYAKRRDRIAGVAQWS